MPGHARKDIVRKGEIGIYHTWSRCVQQAFLCGKDPVTQKDFSHRREWIAKLLAYQASVFAVDIGNYSILSNHQHLIIRLRPDIAKTWSDEEVAWRWRLAWPAWIDGKWVRHPTDEQIEELLAQPEKIVQARENLADLSWFMARWKEPIAKLANAESNRKGHFYEQRFGSREIADEAGVLCTNVYVDLNQIKAKMATSLEECLHSGIQDRILAWQRREAAASHVEFRDETPDEYELEVGDLHRLFKDCFLSPIGQGGPFILLNATGEASTTSLDAAVDESSDATPITEAMVFDDGFVEEEMTEDSQSASSLVERSNEATNASNPTISLSRTETRDPPAKKPTWTIHKRLRQRRRRRASNHVILDMPFAQYLDVVNASVAQLGTDVARPPPDELANVLMQYGIQPTSWIAALDHFEAWFHQAVGSVEHLATIVNRRGQKWLKGLNACRNVFG